MLRVTALYFLSIGYSVVRYVVFAPQNLENLPVFVVNKGLSMAAAFSFSLAFWHQSRARNSEASPAASTWFRAGLFGTLAHVPMSLAILKPGYFKEFFAGDRFSFNGEAVLLFGALAVGCVCLLARTQWPPRQRWALSLTAMLVLLGHTISMGVARGLNINHTHGYLPPMWLFSVIGLALGAAFLLRSNPRGDT